MARPSIGCTFLVLSLLAATTRAWHLCDIEGICDPDEICVRVGSSARCEPKDPCAKAPCREDQTCTTTPENSYVCVCPAGQTETDGACVTFCEVPGVCTDPLMECIPTDTSYDCVCPEGYVLEGEQCVYNDPCRHDPCPEDRQCRQTTGEEFECLCPEGSVAVGDERCVETCDHVTCPDFMDCLLETNSTISCLCRDGEIFDGTECQPACLPSSCPGNMTCIEQTNSFSCECPVGFHFTEGEECVAECDSSGPCEEGLSCVGHNGHYQCCEVGELPHNGACTPVCSIPGICQEGFECLSEQHNGSYSCICPSAMVLANDTCQHICETDPCGSPDLQCTSDLHGFSCECKEEGQCRRCSDLPCEPDFVCIQRDFTHECRCETGYIMKNGRCVDIDECRVGNPCPATGATCTNKPGWYECHCPPGTYYNDTGHVCSSYAMCAADPCDSRRTGAACVDHPSRGFACICPPDKGCCTDCGANELCKEGECTCDRWSVKQKDGSCAPNPKVSDIGYIEPKQEEYTFMVGTSGAEIRVNITNWKGGNNLRYGLVTWVKRPGVQVITNGWDKTPLGHYATPNRRQRMMFGQILPEDSGMYEVVLDKPGKDSRFRPVSRMISVTVPPVLSVHTGLHDSHAKHWTLGVTVQSEYPNATLRWYRLTSRDSESRDHLQLLGVRQVHGPGQEVLRVEPIPAVYRIVLDIPTPTGPLHYETSVDLSN